MCESSGVGHSEDLQEDNTDEDQDDQTISQNNVPSLKVQKLNLDDFCHKLKEHFTILWAQNKVVWPARNARNRPNIDY